MDNFDLITIKSKDKIELIKNKLLKSPIDSKNLTSLTDMMIDFYQHSHKLYLISLSPDDVFNIKSLIWNNFLKVNSPSEIFKDFISDGHVVKMKVNQITLVIVVGKNDKSYDYSLLVKRLHTLNHLYGKFKANIYLALFDQPRTLEYLSKNNSECGFDCQMTSLKNNYKGMTVGGFTTSNENDIFIFKKEEVSKLLIHEIAHLLDLDLGFKEKKYQNPWMTKNDELNIYEAYAELISCIMNSIFMALEFKSFYPKTIFNDTLDYILNMEYTYSFYLSAKLLRWFNVNPDDFFHKKGLIISEPIYVSEYVYLRTMMWMKFDNILINLNFDTRKAKSIKNLEVLTSPRRGDPVSNMVGHTSDEDLIQKFIDQIKLFNMNDNNLSISYSLLEFDQDKIIEFIHH